jgi:hypothetical protein
VLFSWPCAIQAFCVTCNLDDLSPREMVLNQFHRAGRVQGEHSAA